MSNHKLLALFILATLPTLFWGQTSSADIMNVTAVADTYIGSDATTTNYSAVTSGLLTRSLSSPAITRATFVQFTLPADTKLVVDEVVLTLAGRTTGSPALPDVEVLATTTAIDLATVTWNSAVSNSLISGAEADWTVGWNTAGVWTDSGQTWNVDAILTNNTVSYTDATAADGLLKFINDNYNGTSAVTFTIGLGLAGTESGTSGVGFRSLEEISYAAPSLQLTFTAIPEPASFGLLIIGLLTMSTRRRRR